MTIMFKDYINILLHYEKVSIEYTEANQTKQVLFDNNEEIPYKLQEFFNQHSEDKILQIMLNTKDRVAWVTLLEED